MYIENSWRSTSGCDRVLFWDWWPNDTRFSGLVNLRKIQLKLFYCLSSLKSPWPINPPPSSPMKPMRSIFLGTQYMQRSALLPVYIKHQWNTSWAFTWKHDIFISENDWCLYNKYDIESLLGDTKFLYSWWKIFHKWEQYFFNNHREILYFSASI